ncbi:hypothetical protein HY024_04940, partial [Candidatus Curtissbacteria bacterium]|nr:hypothetical protein [Candidatus Curtissbacteria bacterium]
MKHISFLFLPTIFIATFFFRSFKLSTVPFGLYIDETSIGYNAFSIVSTGKDEYGKKFPLFFAAFGEYKLPVYIYSVALVQLIAGPTDLSVRLPALIYGLLSVIFVYYLTREVLEDAKEHKMARIAPYLSALTMG